MHGLEQNVKVKVPSYTYGNALLRLKCAPDLLSHHNIFPNFKEVTESFGAYHAIEKHLREQFPLNDPNIIAVVVGDGSTPRTGATFAYRTAWNVISIDPNLKNVGRYKDIKRLTCVQGKVPDDFEMVVTTPVVLIHVHSHATLKKSLTAIRTTNKMAVVSIPCCVPQFIDLTDDFGTLVRKVEPDIEYEDWGIWSPHRTIKIWKNINE